MRSLRVVLLLAIVLVLICESFAYRCSYIGNGVDPEEYSKFKICETNYCIKDADRLLNAVSQNCSINPCDNIKDFAVGELEKHGVLNERYVSIGFFNDIIKVNWDRQKKILHSKVEESDAKVSKMAKKFFQKCVSANYIDDHATNEVFEYLQKVAGINYDKKCLNSACYVEKFDIVNLIENEAFMSLWILFDKYVARCKDPRNSTNDITCLHSDYTWTKRKINFDDVKKIYNRVDGELKRTNSQYQLHPDAFNSFKKIISLKEILLYEKVPALYRVKSMHELTEYMNFDWIKVINEHYLKNSHINNDSVVLVDAYEAMARFSLLLSETNKKTIADAFTVGFLHHYEHLYLSHYINQKEAIKYGTKKSYQRFEQCISYLKYDFLIGLEYLNAQHQHNYEIQQEALELAKKAINSTKESIMNNKVLNETTKANIIEKLTSIKYIIGFPDSFLSSNKSDIDSIFEDLEISDNMIEQYLRIKKFNLSLSNQPDDSFELRLTKLLRSGDLQYYAKENILYVASNYIQYPYFHPNRSKFFNYATLYVNILNSIETGFELNPIEDEFDVFEIVSNEYIKLESEESDLHLPSFQLSNVQMFWLTLIYTTYAKYHPEVPEPFNFEYRLINKYMHAYFKNRFENFRSVFKCSAPTAIEVEEYGNYLEEFKNYKNKTIDDDYPEFIQEV